MHDLLICLDKFHSLLLVSILDVSSHQLCLDVGHKLGMQICLKRVFTPNISAVLQKTSSGVL